MEGVNRNNMKEIKKSKEYIIGYKVGYAEAEFKYLKEIEKEKQSWLRGKRCFNCGKEKMPDHLNDWCAECWKNA